jgi:putative membrane protein
MAGFLLRLAISAFGLWLASALVPGLAIHGTGTLIAAALLLGFANAVVRPVLVILTFPITVLTLGLFLLVINAVMLILVASLLEGFHLRGLVPAMLGSIVVGLTGWIGSWYIGPRGSVDVMVLRQVD